uniref:Uncharacterized protein n=1 Tax=Anguilla anguilla TaxID=7936 RepID=A0A0E9PI88_ANGAN
MVILTTGLDVGEGAPCWPVSTSHLHCLLRLSWQDLLSDIVYYVVEQQRSCLQFVGLGGGEGGWRVCSASLSCS